MTEITDLSTTDSLNTVISTYSLDGNVANMSTADNVFQSILGMLARSLKSSIWRMRDGTDPTKLLAFDLSGLTTGLTRTQKTPNYNGTLASQALGTAIASGATTSIGAATGSIVHITGTTTITALGTADAGIEKAIIFDGILTLTHNATSLILPGAANITTAAGDCAVMVSEGSGNWRCLSYVPAASRPATYTKVIASGTASGAASVDITGIPANFVKLEIQLRNIIPGTDGVNIWARIDSGAGFISAAAAYSWFQRFASTSTAMTETSSISATSMVMANGFGTGANETGNLRFDVIQSASGFFPGFEWVAELTDAIPAYRRAEGNGRRLATGRVQGVQFLMSTGTISCEYRVIATME